MRRYLDEKETELEAVVCNMCQKELLIEKGILMEGCYSASASFGYFSHKDGQRHQFDLCEDCYDKMIENFKIPIQIKEIKELL